MKKLLNSKFWWIYLIVLLVLVNMLAYAFHFRIDLTSEKKVYTVRTYKEFTAES